MIKWIEHTLKLQFPNKVYNDLNEIYKYIPYPDLKEQADLRSSTPKELLYELGYDKYTKYDIPLMREIIANYDFIQNDFANFFEVEREVINQKLKKNSKIKYPNRNLLWEQVELNDQDLKNLSLMINNKEWEYQTARKKYKLISNFNCSLDKNKVTLILLIHDNSTKKTYVNYNFNPPIEDLLIERLYYSLPESKHVKIPDIKKYIIENLENDDHLSRQSAHELDNLIENTLFKDRLTFLKTIGLVQIKDCIDKRFADKHRFKDRIEKYYNEDTKKVKIPSRSADYAFLANNAFRHGMNIREFIESFGFTYDINIDDSKVREKVINKIKKRIVYTNHVYISSSDPLYNSLNSSAYKKNIPLNQFLYEKYDYNRLSFEELPVDYEIYDWSLETTIDFDEESLKEYIDSYLLTEEGIVEIYSYSDFHIILENFCKKNEILLSDLMHKWNYEYIFISNDRTTKEKFLEEIKQLNSEINRIQDCTSKLSRNKVLVQKMKELYDYTCQICGNDENLYSIIMDNGKNYVELHHIKPLRDFNDIDSVNDESNQLIDHYNNVIVLCAHHHKYVHYHKGGFNKFKGEKEKYMENDNGDNLFLKLNYHLK